MNDLFVFYAAHSKMGDLRYNNIVFRDCTPIATIDDIIELEREIMRLYDYVDAKISHWQRMENPLKSVPEWDCMKVPGLVRRPKCGLKHCKACGDT